MWGHSTPPVHPPKALSPRISPGGGMEVGSITNSEKRVNVVLGPELSQVI